MNWGKKIEPISKKLVIVFMILTFVNILLPDEFIIGIETLQYRLDPFQMIIRWFNFVSFLAVPIAIFYNKPTFNKIAVKRNKDVSNLIISCAERFEISKGGKRD